MLDKWAPVYIDRIGGAHLNTAEAVAANHARTHETHPSYPDLIAVVRYTSTETVRWIGTDGELEA